MCEVEKVVEVSRKLFAAGPASPPVKGKDLYMSEANIDSDLVVIMAALLCALICALGLNSLLRCAFRCSRRLLFEDDVAARLANTGLKKAAMKSLPTITYGSPCKVTADCPICLAEFVEGESLRVLPKCNHAFHVGCIDRWLASHSSCPTCRHCLKNKPSPAPVTSCAPPAPETCCASPAPGTCSALPTPETCCAPPVPGTYGTPVTPSDVVQIIVEAPAGDRSSQVRPDAVAPAVSDLPQESSSEPRADADVS